MKTLALIILSVFLMSGTPETKHRSSIVVHAYFSSGGYNLPICALPIFAPALYVDGVYATSINCPSSTATANVHEGHSVMFKVQVYSKFQLMYSYSHVITAADITNGNVDLIIPM
jgi:hypothetical protein